MQSDDGAAKRWSALVAVVGASCRLPGDVDDPPGLCDALREGRDLVTSVPPDKFEAAAFVDSGHRRPGHSYVGAGGFLTDAAGADAEFFGIFAAGGEPDGSAAAADAGAGVGGAGGCRYPSGCLAGSDTGVFVGLSNRDYAELQHADLRTVDADIGAGGERPARRTGSRSRWICVARAW